MPFLPVAPGVRHQSGTGNGIPGSGSNTKKQTEKILRRDDFTCRFCGFRSMQYQRVIPNPDEKSNQPFVTACTFCEQCLYLERASITGPGVLLWLPEIGQAELNHIIRAIYIARGESGGMSDTATRALDALMTRRSDAKKRLGSDDPLLLATVMQEMLTVKEVDGVAAKIEGIRLLPAEKHIMRTSAGDQNQFPTILGYWRSSEGPYAKMPIESWTEMFKMATAKIGHA